MNIISLLIWFCLNIPEQIHKIPPIVYSLTQPTTVEIERKPVRPAKTTGGGKQYSIKEDWKLDIAKYICTKDWDCNTAIALFYAESGLNPGRKSGTNDHGVAQINKWYQRNRIGDRDLYNAQDNIDIAYEIYQEQGFKPWSAYKNGAYKKYLNIDLEPQNTSDNGY